MGTVTSVGSGNYNTGSTWDSGARPGSSDDVIIANGHTVTLVQDENANSLKSESGSTIVGGGFTITIDGQALGSAANLDGAVDAGSALNLTITTAAATVLDVYPSSGKITNLTINHASCVATLGAFTPMLGNLAITAGELNTDASNNYGLTVAGHVTNNGTLTFNGSTVNLGSTSTEAGDFQGSGTFNLDTSTINYHTAGGANFIPSSSANFDTNTSTLNLIGLNGSNRAHNFTFASGNMHNITTSRGAGTDTHTDTLNGNCTITGDLTVGANSNFSTGTRVFTVNGDVDVTGQLISNGSDKPMTFGSLTINSGGTYNATSGTTTVDQGSTYVLRNLGTYTHNSGTLKVARSSASGTRYLELGSGAIHKLVIDNTATTAAVAFVGVVNCADDLEVTNGKFQAYGGSGDITIDGDVTVSNSSTFKTETSQLAAGGVNATLGSLTINSGATYGATPLTTTITSMTSTGSGDRSLSLVSGGTFTNNSGTVLLNGGSDQRIQMAGTGNLYNLTINKANNEIVTFGDLTILNNLDVTLAADHTWRPNASSDTLTVHGNTYLTTGRMNNGSTQYAGVNNWGNVTINSGEFVLSSGTNNFTGIRNIGGTVSQS